MGRLLGGVQGGASLIRRGGKLGLPTAPPAQALPFTRSQISFFFFNCPRADSRPSQISGFFCDPPTSVSAPALLGIWTACSAHP